ncbi:MAG TPA: DUF1893 domain-containing protein [Dehalococcoidales bacterium]|nr:DUF1893 domain-containing protein [Dehalococcoidales bacterium]
MKYAPLFDEFLTGNDTLRVYEGNQLIFTSAKDRLLPLMEYIDRFAFDHQQVVIFDKIIGNAAALLSIKADCQEVFSPLGSQLAIATLEKYGIKYHFTKIVPRIQKPDGKDMCPMEKLSIGKGPEEFYEAMLKIINKTQER